MTVTGGKVWSPATPSNTRHNHTPAGPAKFMSDQWRKNVGEKIDRFIFKEAAWKVIVAFVLFFVPLMVFIKVLFHADIFAEPAVTAEYSTGGLPKDHISLVITPLASIVTAAVCGFYVMAGVASIVASKLVRAGLSTDSTTGLPLFSILMFFTAGMSLMGCFIAQFVLSADTMTDASAQWVQEKYGYTLMDPIPSYPEDGTTVTVSDENDELREINVYLNEETNKIFLYENGQQLLEAKKG